MCFNRWWDNWWAAEEQRERRKRALLKWKNKLVATAFEGWFEKVHGFKQARELLQKVLKKMQNRSLRPPSTSGANSR